MSTITITPASGKVINETCDKILKAFPAPTQLDGEEIVKAWDLLSERYPKEDIYLCILRSGDGQMSYTTSVGSVISAQSEHGFGSTAPLAVTNLWERTGERNAETMKQREIDRHRRALVELGVTAP
jgi:hypothetical protein